MGGRRLKLHRLIPTGESWNSIGGTRRIASTGSTWMWSRNNDRRTKGPSNLRFLLGLVDAFRAVRAVAASAGIRVNADIQNKLFRDDFGERTDIFSQSLQVRADCELRGGCHITNDHA
jgi:hypothetical protein